MERNLITNNFVDVSSDILDLQMKTERNCEAVFIEYLVKDGVSYGCVFTNKRIGIVTSVKSAENLWISGGIRLKKLS